MPSRDSLSFSLFVYLYFFWFCNKYCNRKGGGGEFFLRQYIVRTHIILFRKSDHGYDIRIYILNPTYLEFLFFVLVYSDVVFVFIDKRTLLFKVCFEGNDASFQQRFMGTRCSKCKCILYLNLF